MFWNTSGLIGTIVTCLGFYLAFIHRKKLWEKVSLILRNPTILFVCADQAFRTDIVDYMLGDYRARGVARLDMAKLYLRKKSLRILMFYLQSEGGMEEIEWSLDFNLINRNIYPLFISWDTDLTKVYNNAQKKMRQPLFEVLSLSEPSFSDRIIQIVKDCHEPKGRIPRRIKRWKALDEINGATVLYATIGDWGATIHACKDDLRLRHQYAWAIDICLHEMDTIADKYGGVVCPDIDEGVTVIFLPEEGEDTLNRAKFAAKEIFSEIQHIVSSYPLLNFSTPRIGIATEWVTLARRGSNKNSIYRVLGTAVSYAKCLAQFATVEGSHILIYDPPLTDKHRNSNHSFGKTEAKSAIPDIPFYRLEV